MDIHTINFELIKLLLFVPACNSRDTFIQIECLLGCLVYILFFKLSIVHSA